MNKMVFTGGGTGGHIFPGLAVAEVLAEKKLAAVTWLGASSGRDREIVERAGVPFYGVPAGKLRRYFSLRNAVDVFKIFAGFVASFFILKKIKPDLVFSKGGFASVPPCYAARVLGIPVVTHECDFSPGLATKLNARIASRILLSYEETAEFLPPAIKARCTVTGNPVRAGFFSASAEAGRAFLGCGGAGRILLVLGGSSGAESLNALVCACLPDLCAVFTVVHQTGGKIPPLPKESAEEAERLRAAGKYFPVEFISKEMPDVLAAADAVVSRAGAGAVWECAAAGKPMILVPLEKGSSRGDQLENAAWFAKRGAAVVLSGGNACPEKLKEAAFSLFPDAAPEGFSAGSGMLSAAAMSAAVADLGKTYGGAGGMRASERIAEILTDCAAASRGGRKAK